MRRAGFVVVYAAANAAAIALAGAAVCGLQLQWYIAIAVLAFAMATLQAFVLFFTDLRVSALRWWLLTLGGTASVTPLAFGVVYLSAVILLGVLGSFGIGRGQDALAQLVFLLPAAFAAVFVAGLQSSRCVRRPTGCSWSGSARTFSRDFSARPRSRTSRWA